MARSSRQIFLTGATGFIGGSILHAICQSHPELLVKVLLRRPEDVDILHSSYSNVEPVIGSLADTALMTSVASNVDFVIHAAGDIGNIPAIHAIIDGLASRPPGRQHKPGFISITGTRRFLDTSTIPTGSMDGDVRPWSDITDADAIASLPETRWHVKEDRAIHAYALDKGVGVILLAPGQCLGSGKGLFKKTNVITAYYQAVLSRGRAFVIGDGSATWSWVSTGDLGSAAVHLIEFSLSEQGEENLDGYYFVQTGDVSMIERAEAISKRWNLGDIEHVSNDIAKEYHPFGPFMWGAGVTFRADKLRKAGWKPRDLDWRALMEEGGGERA